MNAITKFDMTPRQIGLVKHTVAKDCNDDEFNLFMEAARSYGLDPFRKQIIPLVFSKNDEKKRRMSIVVSRDGLRVIAQRCKNYRPASEPAQIEFDDSLKGDLNPKGIVKATIRLWQQDNRGDWFPVIGEAYWDEFAPITDEWGENEQGKWRPTGRRVLDRSGNWYRMPVVMITKCAEAQALRAGWPDEFSGVYVEEEMDKARVLDLNASEIIQADAEESRLKSIAGADAITIFWNAELPLENVPIGQFMDRAIAFIEQVDGPTVQNWQHQNRASLQIFWAKQPGDALELKKKIEKASQKSAKEPAREKATVDAREIVPETGESTDAVMGTPDFDYGQWFEDLQTAMNRTPNLNAVMEVWAKFKPEEVFAGDQENIDLAKKIRDRRLAQFSPVNAG